MSAPGPKNLITDVAGISVGCSEDTHIKTGTTVILPTSAAIAAVTVAGGGPGTRDTDLLRADNLVEAVDAIVLSGGSAFGLGAADGVLARLKAADRGYGFGGKTRQPGVPLPPIVPTAILYDLANGGDKGWDGIAPYAELGAAAYDAAGTVFQLGRSGAGYGARAGQHQGGLGSASIVTDDGITVGALAAVNCFGSVYMPGTKAFWAWPYEVNDEYGGVHPPANYSADAEDWGDAKLNPQPGQNTTIACIATDVTLTVGQAKRVAQMALSGFSRAIRPVFAPFDGDAVFVLSTGRIPLPEPAPMALARLGELAAGTLARAVARGVYEAREKD